MPIEDDINAILNVIDADEQANAPPVRSNRLPIERTPTPLANVANAALEVPLLGDALRGLGTGIGQVASLVPRGLQVGAELLGAEDVAKGLGNFAAANERGLELVLPPEDNLALGDLTNPLNIPGFALQTLGQAVPLVGTALLPGAAGFAAAGVPGAIGGAAVGSTLLNTGEARGDQQQLLDEGSIDAIDPGQALTTGGQNALLDLAGLAIPAGALFGSAARGIAGTAGKAAIGEAATEAAQEANLIRQRGILNEELATFTPEDYARLAEAAVAGGLVGGVLGGGSAFLNRDTSSQATPTEEDTTAAAGVSPLEQQQFLQRVAQLRTESLEKLALQPALDVPNLTPERQAELNQLGVIDPLNNGQAVQPTLNVQSIPTAPTEVTNNVPPIGTEVSIEQAQNLPPPANMFTPPPVQPTQPVPAIPKETQQAAPIETLPVVKPADKQSIVTPPVVDSTSVDSTPVVKTKTQDEIDLAMDFNIGGAGKRKRKLRQLANKLPLPNVPTSLDSIRKATKLSKNDFKRGVDRMRQEGLVSVDGDNLTLLQSLTPDTPAADPNSPTPPVETLPASESQPAGTPIGDPPAATLATPPVSPAGAPTAAPVTPAVPLPTNAAPPAPEVNIPAPPTGVKTGPGEVTTLVQPPISDKPKYHTSQATGRVVRSTTARVEENTNLDDNVLLATDAIAQVNDNGDTVYKVGRLKTLDGKKIDNNAVKFLNTAAKAIDQNIRVATSPTKKDHYIITGATKESFDKLMGFYDQAIAGVYSTNSGRVSIKKLRDAFSADESVAAIQANENVATVDEYVSQQPFTQPMTSANSKQWLQSVEDTLTKYPGIEQRVQDAMPTPQDYQLYLSYKANQDKIVKRVSNQSIDQQDTFTNSVRESVDTAQSSSAALRSQDIHTIATSSELPADSVEYAQGVHRDTHASFYVVADEIADIKDVSFNLKLALTKNWGYDVLMDDAALTKWDIMLENVRNDPDYAETFTQVKSTYSDFATKYGNQTANNLWAAETVVRGLQTVKTDNLSIIRDMQSIQESISKNNNMTAAQVQEALQSSTYFMRIQEEIYPPLIQTVKQRFVEQYVLTKNEADPTRYDGVVGKGRVIAKDLIDKWSATYDISTPPILLNERLIKELNLFAGVEADGFAFKLNGQYYINLSDEQYSLMASHPVTEQEVLAKRYAYETVAHEFGHIIVYDKIDKLETADAMYVQITESYKQWAESRGIKPSSVDLLKMYKQKMSPAGRKLYDPETGATNYEDRRYILSFDEYVADNVATFLTTDTVAATPVQQFFKNIADTLRAFWDSLVKERYIDESIEQFMRSAQRDSIDSSLKIDLSRPIKPKRYVEDAIKIVDTFSLTSGQGTKTQAALKRLQTLSAPFTTQSGNSKVAAQTLSRVYRNTISTMENIARQSGGMRALLDFVYGQSQFGQQLASKYERLSNQWNPANIKLAVPFTNLSRKHKSNTNIAGNAIIIRQSLGTQLSDTQLNDLAANLIVPDSQTETITKQIPITKNLTQTVTLQKARINDRVLSELKESGIPSLAAMQGVKQIDTKITRADGTKEFRNVSSITSRLDEENYKYFEQQLDAHIESYMDRALVDYERRSELSIREVLKGVTQLGFGSAEHASTRNLLLRFLNKMNEDTIQHRISNADDPYIVNLPPTISAKRDAVLADLITALNDGSSGVQPLLADAMQSAGITKEQYDKVFENTSQRNPINESQLKAYNESVDRSIELLAFRNSSSELATKQAAEGFVSIRRFGPNAVEAKFVGVDGEDINVLPAYKTILPFMRFDSLTDANLTQQEMERAFDGLTMEVEVKDGAETKRVPARVKVSQFAISVRNRSRNEISPQDLFEKAETYGVNLKPEQRAVLLKNMLGGNDRMLRQQLKRELQRGESQEFSRAFASNLMEQAYGTAGKAYRADIDGVLTNNSFWYKDTTRSAELQKAVDDTQEGTAAHAVAARERDKYEAYYADVNRVGESRDQAKALVDFVRGNDNLVDTDAWLRFRTVTALAQLGGSISAGAVQLTQLPLATVPYLAYYNPKGGFGGGFGMSATIKKMGRASKVSAKLLSPTRNGGDIRENIIDMGREGKLPNGLDKVMLELFDSNVLDAAQFNALIGSSLGRDSARNVSTQNAIRAWMIPFSKTEQFNRLTTAVATYELAYQQGKAAGRTDIETEQLAKEEAISAIRNTQGEYTLPNRQNWGRTGMGSVLMMYKTYVITMVELFKSLPPKGQATMAGTLIFASGVEGLPFAEDILDLFDDVLRGLGIGPRNSRLAVDGAIETVADFIPGLDPQDASYFFRNGLVDGMTGLNISDRVGLGNLVPDVTAPFTNRQSLTQTLDEFIGPVGGVLHGTESFFQLAQNYGLDDWRTAKSIPITGLRNAIDGYGTYRDGQISDKRGYKVADASLYDSIFRAIGFTTQDQRDAYDNTALLRSLTDLRRKTRTAFMTDLVYHTNQGNKEDVAEVWQEVKQWNDSIGAHTPGLQITIKSKDLARAVQDANLGLEQRTVKILPKALRGFGQQLTLGNRDEE